MRRGRAVCENEECRHNRGNHAKDKRGFHSGACALCACRLMRQTHRPARKAAR